MQFSILYCTVLTKSYENSSHKPYKTIFFNDKNSVLNPFVYDSA